MTMRSLFLVLLVLFLFTGICTGEEEVIYKITLLGNVKIEEAVIRGAIKSREGGPFSTEQVREDLRSIFGLGYFADVQVDIKSTPQGKEVIFIVAEKPSIKDIVISGNQKVKLDDIKEKMTIKTRSILNPEKVKESSEQIRKLYFSKGYYGVNVEYKIDYLETNEAVVRFHVTEGPKGHIKKITFKGNKHIKSSELRKAMMTKQWNIFSMLTKTGTLDEDILKNDLERLTAYYYDYGYLDVKVSEPKIDLRDPKRIGIQIEIVEGPQYRLGDIDFRGDLLTTKEDLFKTLKIKRNDVYRNSAIRKDINALTEKFANQGYAYVEIAPEPSVDRKNLLVHITFEIEKKKRIFFEKIQIVGNTKTRDKVIRRELRFAEGELYGVTPLNKSRDRLKRTGFFKAVDFTSSRGSTDEMMNLDIKVEEAQTGSVSFGVGYSSVDKIFGTATIQDRNLFGMGYHGLLQFRLGTIVKDVRISFTDPYFLGSHYAAGIDLYNDHRDFTTYSYRITGGDLRLGRQLTDIFRVDAMYKLEKTTVYNINTDPTQGTVASIFIQQQAGTLTTSAISLTPAFDTRDDYYNPTRGARHSLFMEYAGGILGFESDFIKVLAQSSWYFPMPWNTVLNLGARVGFIQPYGNNKFPLTEKFFVGGIYSLRGFKYGMAGPVDVNNEALGAEKMVVFNSELIFTLSREIGLRGAIFFDVGKGFDKWGEITPLNFGAGPGIRWYSPFGPISIYLGINLNPHPQEGQKRFVLDFAAGQTF